MWIYRSVKDSWETGIEEKRTKIDTDRPVVHRKVRHCGIEW